MRLFCGIDWATHHHDVAVIDDDGRVVARGRVANDSAGFAALLTLLAEAGDNAADPIPIGSQTNHGLWVAALRETGRTIYPINPLAASRYGARYAVSGAKSDATDAVLLANIVRTDPGAHRLTSFPGLGMLAGSQVLAEIGDDRARFTDARRLKAFAGAAPITRASGKKTVVLHRHINNTQLAAVGPIWALASLGASPGARRRYDTRRAGGDWNHRAQRHLFNKFGP